MTWFTWAILILGLILFAVQAIAMKKVKITSLREDLLLTGLFSSIIAVGFWIYSAVTRMKFSGITIGYGILFGILFIATFTVYFFALHTGPMSYTVFFCAASMVIPALAGSVIWHDELSWMMILGIALFIAAFFFISVPGAQKGKKANTKWMILCLFTWLLNGSLSILVKAQQMAMIDHVKKNLLSSVITMGKSIDIKKDLQASSMTTIAFTSAAVICFIVYFFLLSKDKNKSSKVTVSGKTDMTLMKHYVMPILLLAVGNGGGNFVLTYLSGNVPSALLFPFVQGGMMVVVSLYSALLLKEKINKWGVVGIVLGIIALVVINF